jgi:uncharacterized protein
MGDGAERRLAVVTGGAEGIGWALAQQMADRGFDFLLASDSDDLETAGARLRDRGGEVVTFRADLASRGGVADLHRRLEDLGRPIAVLSLNPRVGRCAPTESSEGAAPHMVDLEVRGALHLTELCLPTMVERGTGGVLFTAAVSPVSDGAPEAAVGSSTAHLASFVDTTRAELEGTGVTVTLLVVATHHLPDAARNGLDGLEAGERRVVAGRGGPRS